MSGGAWSAAVTTVADHAHGGGATPPPWVTTIGFEAATGELQEAYAWQAARIGAPTEFTLLGSLHAPLVHERLRLYKTVEDVPSRLSARERAYAAYVTSLLNRTHYCASGARLKLQWSGVAPAELDRLEDGFETVRLAVAAGAPVPEGPPRSGDGRLDAIAVYATGLTLRPGGVTERDIVRLREAGLDDLDILDVNNIVAYYNYVNRVANGLGLRHPIADPDEALRAVPG